MLLQTMDRYVSHCLEALIQSGDHISWVVCLVTTMLPRLSPSPLDSDREAIQDTPAVYFIAPTSENIKRVCQVMEYAHRLNCETHADVHTHTHTHARTHARARARTHNMNTLSNSVLV